MVSEIIARARSLWRGIRRRATVESEMREEFQAHVEMRARDLERLGLTPSRALQQARREFGSPERYKEEARESRGLGGIDSLRFSWLDFKLGFRMLSRYPGLTMVGGVAMAFGIFVGADTFELTKQWIRPDLRLADSDRIVGVQLLNAVARRGDQRLLHEYGGWRRDVKSIEDLSAFRELDRNLLTGVSEGIPVEVAEITASAFNVTRVPAQLGRVLIESDEQPGAPPVMVIGHKVWQERFGGDPNVVGRAVRLGATSMTVVGVMPKGFAFPVYQDVWIPFRLNPLAYSPFEGPTIHVFGRLAAGVSLEDAQRELSHLGERAAADFPDTYKALRPQVVPYARSIVTLSPSDFAGLRWVNLAIVLLVVLVCGNVAMLIFARAAMRESEIVVRNALGASRGRIIMQLFAEALVLGAVGTAFGLAAAKFGLGVAVTMLRWNLGDLPYWVNANLSTGTLLYALLLTVLGALVAGVLPALRLTRSVSAQLRQTSAGGGGLSFGGIWTVVIVTQVAVTLVAPVTVVLLRRELTKMTSFDVGFAESQYVTARLELDHENEAGHPADSTSEAYLARMGATYQELKRRLTLEAGVGGVTFADPLPRSYHYGRQLEVVEDSPAPRDSILGRYAKTAYVDIDFHEVMGAAILAGRAFHSGDLQPNQRSVIVNQSFVNEVLQGRNAVGRRIRFINPSWLDASTAGPGPWNEIVGVARDLGMHHEGSQAGAYFPVAHAEHVIVKVSGESETFIPRLRVLSQAVEPGLRLYNPASMDEELAGVLRLQNTIVRSTLFISGLALLLSLAGIYAVMSFTVSRRTREIGIRVALGAASHRVVLAVLRRPLAQVGFGIAVGGYFVYAIVAKFVGTMSIQEVALVLAYALVMTSVCMLACVVPTRRALAVEPTDALRADG